MRYIDQENTILDSQTNLIWDKSYKTNLTFDEALAYADQVNKDSYLGYNDWRVPTVSELISLVDYTKYDPASKFPNMPSSDFWSSAPYAHYSDAAWFVYFDDGYADNGYRSSGLAVRLVRNGKTKCTDGLYNA
ncbi:hypothetical protein CCP4SC76_7640003 [Gammaproteobacteria bacterium]